MYTHFKDASFECFDDELDLLRLYLLHNLLDYMISVCVFDAFNYLGFDLFNNFILQR